MRDTRRSSAAPGRGTIGYPATVESPARLDRSGLRTALFEQGNLDPTELAHWLDDQAAGVVQRWHEEIARRGGLENERLSGLIRRFLHHLAAFLPQAIGPYRQQVDGLWQDSCELYGSFSAMRGLAAGEVLEEFHIFREQLIRRAYADSTAGEPASVSLREVLSINRFLDRGATHATVGHTDSLFFSLFQGSGVPAEVTDEVMDEVEGQVADFAARLKEVLGHLAH